MNSIFKCKFCGQGFVRESALHAHEVTIHVQMNHERFVDDGIKTAFHCKICGFAFPNLDMVEIHESKH